MDAVRVQPGQPSIRKQDLAVLKRDILHRRRILQRKITITFAFASQHLDELFLVGSDRRALTKDIPHLAPEHYGIVVRKITRFDTFNFFPVRRNWLGRLNRGRHFLLLGTDCRGLRVLSGGGKRATVVGTGQEHRWLGLAPEGRLLRARQIPVLVPSLGRPPQLVGQLPERQLRLLGCDLQQHRHPHRVIAEHRLGL